MRQRVCSCGLVLSAVAMLGSPSCDLVVQGVDTTVTDIDGNVYHTVTIGTQVWMLENLKTTKYNDGSAIPLVTDSTEWATLSSPGYCWYDNDSTGTKNTYGVLYNCYAVNRGTLAPVGWHVPTDAEWETLGVYLGGSLLAGGKLKEAGTAHWASSPHTRATNSSGFTALPGGYRDCDGAFSDLGIRGNWWSASANNSWYSWYRRMVYNSADASRYVDHVQSGFSVRCVRD